MAAARRQWLLWLAALAALAVIGAGSWYAHARGWLAPLEDWARRLVKPGAGAASHGGMGMGGMSMGGMSMGGMSMGGMSMGSMSLGKHSEVPGHAEVTLPGEVRQRIGVTVGTVKEAPLRMSVRTVGIVQTDETKLAHVHLKTEGWVHKVFVDYIGQQVEKGAPLLSIYSPQFLTTQREYLSTRRAERGRRPLGGDRSLAGLALQRLELWDVPKDEIRQLEKTGKPHKYLTLRSPIKGTVLSRNAFAGQYVTPQTELYAVADLSTVWVQAKVYEYELPHVELGQPVAVTVPALPERKLTGKVVFVQPTVDQSTRTAQVRIELPNKEGLLRPGMFAHVVIEHAMGKGLLVPASAVIRTGERDIAYRVESKGRFVPVVVQVSPLRFGNRFQVLEGLKAGERVATSANFLIDSESRLRAGGGMSMPGMAGIDMGGKKGKESTGMKGMKHGKDDKGGHEHGGMKGMKGMDRGKREGP
jgi:Cu(I)/Ag(I) efflux system membrane fusion protein